MALITFSRRNKSSIKILVSALAIVVVIVVILLVVFLTGKEAEKIARGSAVANGYGCAKIATDIMEKGGNAVDAAIAALFCDGVSMPHSMGLGGGFLLTLYNKTTGEMWSLNSRESAPAAATENMFNGNASLSLTGGLSVAVPSELIGYWKLYQRFGGGVPWRDLVQPTIDLCKNGILVTNYLARTFQEQKEIFNIDPVLRSMFVDPTTNDTYQEGDYMKRLSLARTLEIIAEEGGYALNNGSLTESFVQDIRDNGGIITVEDMNNYEPQWQEPVQTTLSGDFGNLRLFSAPIPGSGAILTFILNLLENFLDASNPKSITNYQRLVESCKFAYAERTFLGDRNLTERIANITSKSFAEEKRRLIFDNRTFQDPAYYGANMTNVEDRGTGHISILAPNGDSVSVTSTINYLFGAKFASNSTGIILNNEMDDFSSPNITNVYGLEPSTANFIVPGRRPLSSMCPTIILDQNGDVLMSIGGAGGSKITTGVAQIIVNHLLFGVDLETAIYMKRLHHQLTPMEVAFEDAFRTEDTQVVEELRNIGHNYSFQTSRSVIHGISTYNQPITGISDSRRFGSASYIY